MIGRGSVLECVKFEMIIHHPAGDDEKVAESTSQEFIEMGAGDKKLNQHKDIIGSHETSIRSLREPVGE